MFTDNIYFNQHTIISLLQLLNLYKNYNDIILEKIVILIN
jgi:hypothetical protein